MHMTRLLVVAALMVASFTSPLAIAADGASDLAMRDTWQSSQVLVRTAMKVQLAANANGPAKEFWLFTERTPSGHIRVVMKDTLEGAIRLTFLIQGSETLALSGEDVSQPAAPWMLGHYLFGQALEPAMLLQWAIGLPGKDFSMDAEVAAVGMDKGRVAHIEQSGWRVDYAAWAPVAKGGPALPADFLMTGQDVSARVSLIGIDAYPVAPPNYSEFKIM